MLQQQISDTILMVRPAHFGYNEETAASNAFQTNVGVLSAPQISALALAEFDAFVNKLRDAGVKVVVVEDTSAPLKADAIFPNNWITTHSDGVIITYPMFSAMRRLERRTDIVDQLSHEYEVTNWLRLEQHEADNLFLEGTGSMILDRAHRVVYACRSVRTDEGLLREFAASMKYEVEVFDALDPAGLPIYHTNVMMALGETLAVICLDSIVNAAERASVVARLQATGKAIVEIFYDQMMRFAGNMLQVRGAAGQSYLVMSEQAYRSLLPQQIAEIEAHTRILYADLHTIETYGGGSARCMMAEVFLPEKTGH